MRKRTVVLGSTLAILALATVVACTGDSDTTDSTGDAGKDGSTGVDGSQNQGDATISTTDSGNALDSGSADASADTGVDAGFAPSQLGGKLVLWLSADKNYAADGGGTAVWKDQSSYGNDAIQATPTYQPVFLDGGSGVNGNPALHFAGSQYLQIADVDSLQWAASDFTLFVVERHSNDSNAYAIVYAKWTNVANEFPGIFLWASYPTTNGNLPTTGYVTRLDTDNEVYSTDAGYNDGVARVVGLRMQGGSDLQLYVNGHLAGEKADASIADAGAFNAPAIPAYIGGRPDFIQMLQGDVSEVVAVKGTMSDQEIANLQAYLQHKYGL